MQKILHLTHTDISIDGRILKEMDAIKSQFNCELLGLGISDKQTDYSNNRVSYSLRRNHKMKRPRLIWYALLYLGIAKEVLSQKRNIIHVHDWFMLPIATLHKLTWQSKLIYDAHELESDTNTRSILRKKAALFTEYLCIKSCDSFITVSHSILKWYHRKFNFTCNKCVILNAPDAPKEPTTKKLPNDKLIVIYVGGIEEGRGIEMAINVFPEFEGKIEFQILGYGSKELEFKELVRKRNISNVRFLGRVKHDEVLDIVKNADIGLCLIEPISKSDELCLPNKLFEYYNSGLTVISSNLPEIFRFVRENDCGYSIDLNPKSLRYVLEDAYKNHFERENKARSNRFNWKHQSQKLISTYSVIMQQDEVY